MKTDVTPEQVRSYQENGFLAVPDFLDPGELQGRVGSVYLIGVQGGLVVGSAEADPAAGRISNASPVGRALLGRSAGETVAVKTPRGEKVIMALATTMMTSPALSRASGTPGCATTTNGAAGAACAPAAGAPGAPSRSARARRAPTARRAIRRRRGARGGRWPAAPP